MHDQRGNRQKFLGIQSNLNQISIPDSTHSQSSKNQTNSNIQKQCQTSFDENSNLLNHDQSMNLRSRTIHYSDEKANRKTYNTQKYPQVAIVADRLKISNRDAAQIVNATLVDVGLLSSADKTLAVGAKKIGDARKRQRETRLKDISFDGIKAIYFDGRKDETFEINNGARKFVQREHISFVSEPGSFFVGHKTPPSGHSREILQVLNEILAEKTIEINDIKAIGCDGTNVNTGYRNGVIRSFELEHKTPVQWIICMLHGIELLLRTLIENFDGAYKSKNNLSGPVGQILNDCEKMKVVDFGAIDFPCDILDDETILSTDQKYLFEMCKAISAGCVHPSLAARTIGPINKARWVTTACRYLRVYVAEENPSENFRVIVEFIVKVYAPMIFKVKNQSSVVYGAVHLAEIIKSSRARSLIDESIGRNSYAAHAESITLAMVNDEKIEIRRQGWLNILNARNASNSSEVREFRVPKINYKCDSYLNIIDINLADPPLLRDIDVSIENIDFLSSKPILAHSFGAFLKKTPLHTQSVERAVKETTSAAKQLSNERARDGLILNTLASRNAVPKFDSKKDFHEVNALKKYKI